MRKPIDMAANGLSNRKRSRHLALPIGLTMVLACVGVLQMLTRGGVGFLLFPAVLAALAASLPESGPRVR